jgi:uncharacterized membrane protein
LLLFTDAVYAIALTLLALDLRLPPEAVQLHGAELLASLFGIWPILLSHFTSFTVVGLFWSLHLRTHRHIEHVDGGLAWLTLLHLACITFLPFPTTVIGEHLGDPVAEEFYFGCLLVTTVLAALSWWYATINRRLVAPDLPDEIIKAYRILAGIATSGLLLLMILVALGLGRVFEPLVLGYIFTFVFIVEGVLDWYGRGLRDWRTARVSPQTEEEAA